MSLPGGRTGSRLRRPGFSRSTWPNTTGSLTAGAEATACLPPWQSSRDTEASTPWTSRMRRTSSTGGSTSETWTTSSLLSSRYARRCARTRGADRRGAGVDADVAPEPLPGDYSAMSYACIDRDELNRRGLCEEVPRATPSIIRETIIEPVLEPIFVDTPFSSSPAPWGGGRWFGGSDRRPRRRPPVWRPGAPGRPRGVSSWPSGGSGRRVGGTIDRLEPEDDFPRRSPPSTSIAYPRSPSPSYTASLRQARAPSMATPSRQYEASPTAYTARLSTAPTARRYEAAPTTYTARPSTVTPRASYQAAPAARTATSYSGWVNGLPG